MIKAIGQILSAVVWLGIAVIALVILVIPIAVSVMVRWELVQGPMVLWINDAWRQVHVPAMQTFIVAWIFFVGSSIGSFLNVVASRLPQGKSLFGASRCPQCEVKLSFPGANVPVLGWLKNGGQCFRCDWPIPLRYLIVEIVLGSCFLILFAATVASGGACLPFRPVNAEAGIEIVVRNPSFDLLFIYACQLTLISIVFTCAIAATEASAAPGSLVAFGALAAIGFQCTSHGPGIVDFHLVAWEPGGANGQFLYWTGNATGYWLSVALGVLAGGLCFAAIVFSHQSNLHGTFASLLLIGIFLGWQAVVSTTLFWFLLSFFIPVHACGKLFVAAVMHLCLWRLQTHCFWWVGPASGLPQLLIGVICIAGLASVHRFADVGLYRHFGKNRFQQKERP